jgi:hypothetical protein
MVHKTTKLSKRRKKTLAFDGGGVDLDASGMWGKSNETFGAMSRKSASLGRQQRHWRLFSRSRARA